MNTILIISLFAVCLGFMSFGYYVSRGKISRSAFLVSDRNVDFFGITFSLTASCFGIWILIGPAEASTWGGVGAVIGYAAGQSFVFLYQYATSRPCELVSRYDKAEYRFYLHKLSLNQ